MTLALDRMVAVKANPIKSYIENTFFDPNTYYPHTIGVTVKKTKPKIIRIFVNKYSAPYVLTKPLHHSQKVLETLPKGIIIQVEVIINFEFERLILGFGETMQVLSPKRLKLRLKRKFADALERYSDDGDMSN